MKRCCGTCRHWEPEGTSKEDFKERLKHKFSLPHCRLDGKTRGQADGKGCLGWKEADPWDVETRGYNLD